MSDPQAIQLAISRSPHGAQPSQRRFTSLLSGAVAFIAGSFPALESLSLPRPLNWKPSCRCTLARSHWSITCTHHHWGQEYPRRISIGRKATTKSFRAASGLGHSHSWKRPEQLWAVFFGRDPVAHSLAPRDRVCIASDRSTCALVGGSQTRCVLTSPTTRGGGR